MRGAGRGAALFLVNMNAEADGRADGEAGRGNMGGAGRGGAGRGGWRSRPRVGRGSDCGWGMQTGARAGGGRGYRRGRGGCGGDDEGRGCAAGNGGCGVCGRELRFRLALEGAGRRRGIARAPMGVRRGWDGVSGELAGRGSDWGSGDGWGERGAWQALECGWLVGEARGRARTVDGSGGCRERGGGGDGRAVLRGRGVPERCRLAVGGGRGREGR